MTEPAAEVSLNLLVLKSLQMDKLRAFYQCFGIAFIGEHHGKGPVHYAGHVAGVILEIYPLPNDVGTPDRTTRLGFAVTNMDQIVDALQAIGTPITTPPEMTGWGRRAVVQDPDGRAVELCER